MRRRASSSTARSGRERLAPRTFGITQNAQPNVQPSCTLTNARVRSSRGAGPTQAVAPSSRAMRSAASSAVSRTTVTRASALANASRAEPRRAAGHVDVPGAAAQRRAHRLAALGDGLVRDAAGVDDVHRAALARLLEAAGQQPLAHALHVGLRDLAAEELDREAHAARLALEQQPLPPVPRAALGDPVARDRERLAREQARDDQARRQVGPPGELLQRRELQVREPQRRPPSAARRRARRTARPGSHSRCGRRSRPPPRRRSGRRRRRARARGRAARPRARARPSRSRGRAAGPGGCSSSSSRHSSVVACEPVPKACPGSITTAGRPAGGVSQGGPTHSLPPTVRPGVERAPAVLPAVGDGLLAPRAGDVGQARRAIRAVDRELQPAGRAAALLHAVGERLEHCRARDLLGLVAGRAREHEPDHPKALRNRSRRPRERSGSA